MGTVELLWIALISCMFTIVALACFIILSPKTYRLVNVGDGKVRECVVVSSNEHDARMLACAQYGADDSWTNNTLTLCVSVNHGVAMTENKPQVE